MRLPIIKQLTDFIQKNDVDYVKETIETLESLTEAPLKDEELDVIGELISNMEGAVEVDRMIKEENMSEKEALNTFMKRVLHAIGK